MLRLALLLALLLPVLGFTTGTGGTGAACLMAKGATCYSEFTANGAKSVSIAACAEARVNFRSNIANAADNDATATVYACPAGVTTVTAACGIAIGYRDADGTAQTTLTGASGRDNIYGVVAQNLVVDVAVTGQTARVQVDCR